MSGILSFDTKRDMEMMSAVLLGKGKKVTPRKQSSGHMSWSIAVDPPVRWSTERSYLEIIKAFDASVCVVNNLIPDPVALSRRELDDICVTHWVCRCSLTKIRPMIHDKCFICGSSKSLHSRNPEREEMANYLKVKHEELKAKAEDASK